MAQFVHHRAACPIIELPSSLATSILNSGVNYLELNFCKLTCGQVSFV